MRNNTGDEVPYRPRSQAEIEGLTLHNLRRFFTCLLKSKVNCEQNSDCFSKSEHFWLEAWVTGTSAKLN